MSLCCRAAFFTNIMLSIVSALDVALDFWPGLHRDLRLTDLEDRSASRDSEPTVRQISAAAYRREEQRGARGRLQGRVKPVRSQSHPAQLLPCSRQRGHFFFFRLRTQAEE